MKRIFILVPDGVGLRNFLFTDFKLKGENRNYEIIYWNDTDFSFNEHAHCNELNTERYKQNSWTLLLCRIKKRIELNLWSSEFNDNVYQLYKFPLKTNAVKHLIKSIVIKCSELLFSSKKGLAKIKSCIARNERRSKKYQYCLQELKRLNPDLILSTSQRATTTLPIILAATDLEIKTACFIHSWDNTPKAMKLIETDYYFVWSDLMKDQLLQYYPYVHEQQIFVTGTPQFVPHYDHKLIYSREEFCKKHGLDPARRYICFSGDDITTSPLDQFYLEDLAKAVRSLNDDGHNIGIIYRKCPVDFTNRYEKVINENNDVIVVIDPLWRQQGSMWNQIVPTKDDYSLLSNICEHSELVTNVCSSTVFDFVIHNKPCIYYNYEQPQLRKGLIPIGQHYKYVHFRSMPSKSAVVWAKDKGDLKNIILQVLLGQLSNVAEAKKWFKIVNNHPPEEASARIWDGIDNITQ